MKFLTKKGFWNKLIIVFLILIIFNILIPNHKVQADYEVGGALLKPVNALVLKIADGVVDMIHKVIFGTSTALLEYDTTGDVLKMICILVGIALVILAGIATGWIALHAVTIVASLANALGAAVGIASGLGVVGVVVKCAAAGATIAGMYLASSWYGQVAVFPMYQISPQEIFENKIGILNPNFFATSSNLENTIENVDDEIQQIEVDINTEITNKKFVTASLSDPGVWYGSEAEAETTAKFLALMREYGFFFFFSMNYRNGSAQGTRTVLAKWSKDYEAYEADLIVYTGGGSSSAAAADAMFHATLEIYKGQYAGSAAAHAAVPIANTLKPVISKWYYALRTLALILMMAELVYIGIRIMLCSVASEKAKYKNMLKDWVVAICLLFVMHYIMAFATNLVDSFTNIVSTLAGDHEYVVEIEDENGAIRDAMQEDDIDVEYVDGNKILWDAGNLMGIARMQAAIQSSEVPGVSYIGYTIAFIVLVFYTIFFLFTYLKRLIYLTFLTIIAPMVAFTYPLDKINDGKAQAFDMWFKEYIFNLLIQPFHLILYTVLITAAFDLASENILYTLVAIGFMMPAEKLLRRFFGFEKAQTPGTLSGAAGAALVMTGMNKLLHKKPSKSSKDGESENDKIKEKDDLDSITSDDGIDNSLLFGEESTTKKSKADNENKSQESNNKKTKRPVLRRIEPEPKPQPAPKAPVRNAKSATKKLRLKPIGKPTPSASPSMFNGIAAAAKSYGRQQFKRAVKNGGKFVKKMPRRLAGAALGVGAGMIGAAAGIASGDFGKVAQYGGAGVAGGYALGSNLTDFAGGVVGVDENQMQHEFEVGYYGSEEEYKKAKLEERRKKYIENEKNIKELQSYLNCDEKTAIQVLEEYSDCIDAGITDTKDIAAISRAVESGWSKEKAMTAARTLKKAGGEAPGKMGKKAREDWDFKAANIVKKAGATDIGKAVEQTNATLDDFVAFKDDLTTISKK